MWNAKNKIDLIIEVWEKLDCESVGTAEIEAITKVVRGIYGDSAVDSPMKIARLLADEGAELRHSEIMNLYIEYASDRPYTAEFRNIYKFDTMPRAVSSLRDLENLRRKFLTDKDKEGLRLIRERTIEAKKEVVKRTSSPEGLEIAEWITIWLQTPDAFENWLSLRKRSSAFKETFGEEF